MNKKYCIGDRVWLAQVERLIVKRPCDVCYGKKTAKLILGNDDIVELPCSYCAPGYNPPQGFIEEYDFVSDVKQVCIEGMSIDVTEGGEKIEYRTDCHAGGYRILKMEDIFDTQGDAELRVVEIRENLLEEQTKRSDYIKHDKKKSYSWNAGYHLREAKKAKKSMEYHENMCVLCKQKDE